MIEIESTTSCGINEISSISESDNTPEGIVKYIVRNADKKAHFIYSDVTMKRKKLIKSKGEELSKYIKKHKLGKITVSPPALNKNSGNTIKQWIWTPDHKELKTWYKKIGKQTPNLPEREENMW